MGMDDDIPDVDVWLQQGSILVNYALQQGAQEEESGVCGGVKFKSYI